MKSFFTWIFWIAVAIAGWRWFGPSIRDLGDEIACIYRNTHGDCMSESEYIKMVAHDAAVNAITDFVAECSGPFNNDSRCTLFKRN